MLQDAFCTPGGLNASGVRLSGRRVKKEHQSKTHGFRVSLFIPILTHQVHNHFSVQDRSARTLFGSVERKMIAFAPGVWLSRDEAPPFRERTASPLDQGTSLVSDQRGFSRSPWVRDYIDFWETPRSAKDLNMTKDKFGSGRPRSAYSSTPFCIYVLVE